MDATSRTHSRSRVTASIRSHCEWAQIRVLSRGLSLKRRGDRLSDPRRCEKSGNQDSGVPDQEEVSQGVVRCRANRGMKITGLHIKEKNEIREDLSERRNIEMILAKKIKIEVSEDDAR